MNQKINIQEIKDSGILEQFALGLTDAKQNVEINSWLAASPELQSELIEIQNSLEVFASQYAVPVPDRIKTNIIQRIEQESKLLDLKELPQHVVSRHSRCSHSFYYYFFLFMDELSIQPNSSFAIKPKIN